MRHQLIPLRKLPMGQDDDSFDYTESNDISPVIAPTDYSAAVAPDLSSLSDFSSTPIYSGAGPAAPGETVLPTQTTDLPSLIASGALPPPAGSGLTSAQVQQIVAAGGTANDIDSILSGQTNASTVLNLLKTGTAGATALATLTSQLQARATPVTSPTGAAGTVIGSTSTASPLTALTAATIIPGIPNWVVGAGGLLAVAAIASLAGGKR